MIEKISLYQEDNAKISSEYPTLRNTDNNSLLQMGDAVAKIFRNWIKIKHT